MLSFVSKNRIPQNTKDPPILRAKLLAFCVPLSGVAWSRFQNFVLLDAGYSPTTIGFLKSSSYFGKIIFAPFWGIVGDLYSPVFALLVSYVISGLSLELMRQCIIHKWSFYAIYIIKMVRSACNCIGPVTEAVLFSVTRRRKDGESYGKQRIWSSIAWGGGSLFAGCLIDQFGLWSIFPFTYLMICIAIIILYTFSLTDFDNSKHQVDEHTVVHKTDQKLIEEQQSKLQLDKVMEGLNQLLLHPELSKTAYQVIFTGFFMTLVDQILPIQLEKKNVSRWMNGLTTFISIMSSIPIYYYCENIIQNKGIHWMFQIAQSVYGIRLLGMATLSFFNPAYQYILLIFFQLLHGITFALIWLGATYKIQSLSYKLNLTTSASTLVSTLYFTIGQGFGNVFWMYLYQIYQNCGLLYFSGFCIIVFNVLLTHKFSNRGGVLLHVLKNQKENPSFDNML